MIIIIRNNSNNSNNDSNINNNTNNSNINNNSNFTIRKCTLQGNKSIATKMKITIIITKKNTWTKCQSSTLLEPFGAIVLRMCHQ